MELSISTPLAKGFVLGICLDGVLRDISPTFHRAYAERFGPKAEVITKVVTAQTEETAEGEAVLRLHATDVAEGDVMAPLRMVGDDEEREVPNLDEVTPYNILDKFKFNDDKETDDFVIGEGFFIFARAPHTEVSLATWLNQLYYGVHKQGGRLALLCSDVPKLRPAALFFASDLGGFFDEIHFLSTPTEFWDRVDILFTASSGLLAARPAHKKAIHRLTDYNNPEGYLPNDAADTRGMLNLTVTKVADVRQALDYFPA